MICTLLLVAAVQVIAQESSSAQTEPRQNEQRILDAERSRDLSVFQELLADGCITIGPDGRRHTKAELLEIIRRIPRQNVTASDFVVIPAGRDAVVINYLVSAVLPDGTTRQHSATSIWVHGGGSWRMQFHQGTQIAQ